MGDIFGAGFGAQYFHSCDQAVVDAFDRPFLDRDSSQKLAVIVTITDSLADVSVA